MGINVATLIMTSAAGSTERTWMWIVDGINQPSATPRATTAVLNSLDAQITIKLCDEISRTKSPTAGDKLTYTNDLHLYCCMFEMDCTTDCLSVSSFIYFIPLLEI
jgi:hypothetical protein